MGMVSFAFADISQSPDDQESNANALVGCMLLLFSLCCDSLLGNFQEKVQKAGLCDELSLMYIQSLFGGFFLLVLTLVTGEFQKGATKALSSPQVMICLNVWSILSMVGIVLLLKVAGEFSAVTAVVTGLVRKFFSIVVSYTFFPKPLGLFHCLGLIFVFFSAILHTHWKETNKMRAARQLEMAGPGLHVASLAFAAGDERVEAGSLRDGKESGVDG